MNFQLIDKRKYIGYALIFLYANRSDQKLFVEIVLFFSLESICFSFPILILIMPLLYCVKLNSCFYWAICFSAASSNLVGSHFYLFCIRNKRRYYLGHSHFFFLADALPVEYISVHMGPLCGVQFTLLG